MDRRFIGIEELAKYFGLSINTVRSWVWRRQIPYLKVGRLVRFDLREIEDWIKDRKVNTIR